MTWLRSLCIASDATPIVEHSACHYDIKTVDLDISKLSKGGFDHFMLVSVQKRIW